MEIKVLKKVREERVPVFYESDIVLNFSDFEDSEKKEWSKEGESWGRIKMFKPRGMFGGIWKPKNPHSLEHLK